jgi:hypothetical protein
MERSHRVQVASALVAILIGACTADPVDTGRDDAGSMVGSEAGAMDAGGSDAGRTDAGRTDAGRTDAGRTDAGRADAGACIAKGRVCGPTSGSTDPCCDGTECIDGTCGGCGGEGLVCRTGSTAVRDCCEGLVCSQDLPGGDVQCCRTDPCPL